MTMIEKVAQAIENHPDTRHLCIGASSAVSLAKAVIEAMRYPNEVMIEAGYNAKGNEYGEGCPPNVVHYRLMIDAALKE